MSKSIVRTNAEKDASYCPYCMRCSGMVRMKKVADFYWRCKCGAEHDERCHPECNEKDEACAACPAYSS